MGGIGGTGEIAGMGGLGGVSDAGVIGPHPAIKGETRNTPLYCYHCLGGNGRTYISITLNQVSSVYMIISIVTIFS